MTRRNQPPAGKPALELLEEAVHLLRQAPAGLWVAYYLGALPFVFGFLYFWSDMARSAFAGSHCASAALGTALLYLWMKCWQTVFARALTARVSGRALPAWTWRQRARLVLIQAVLQPMSLFVLPVALVITLPFAWVYAFYQNVSVIGDGSAGDLPTIFNRARRLSAHAPKQNHLLITFLFLFGVFIFLNLAVALFVLPSLLQTLVGLATVFSKSHLAWLNTTFLAAVVALTYLCLGPLIKAVYTLRCFYAESLESGRDLIVELERVTSRPRGAAATLWVCAALLTAASPGVASGAEVRAVPLVRQAVSSADLDRSLSEVIQKREYAWRLPREKPSENAALAKGPLALFIEGVADTVRGGVKWLIRAAKRGADWVLKHWLNKLPVNPAAGQSSAVWIDGLYGLLCLLLAAIISSLAILGWRSWRQRRHRHPEPVADPIPSTPDLADEGVAADQLPSTEWLSLAHALMARGELRLALRALYLASLSLLAQRELLVIARFKSNRDYERELQRRAHTQPELLAAFGQNAALFERSWYGRHEVTSDSLSRCSANLEKLQRDEPQ